MRKGRNAPKKVGNHCCRGKNTETTQQPLKDFIQMLLVMYFSKGKYAKYAIYALKAASSVISIGLSEMLWKITACRYDITLT